eukprot:superscaffoldBa00004697_g19315
MPGQLGDPVEISGAKGTADVTVSGLRTLPSSLSPFPYLLRSDRKMPSEEFGSKTRFPLDFNKQHKPNQSSPSWFLVHIQ